MPQTDCKKSSTITSGVFEVSSIENHIIQYIYINIIFFNELKFVPGKEREIKLFSLQ